MRTTDVSSCEPPRRSLAHEFNKEWRRIVDDPGTRQHLASWPAGSPAARYPEPQQLLAATGRDGGLPMAEADRVLAGVVRLAPDDGLAARLALQRVLPGLVRAAVRRTVARPGDRQSMFDDLATTAWLVIRSYPIDRRPAKIAANVVRDAEYLTCVRPFRLRSGSELPVGAIERQDHRRAGLDGRPTSHSRHAGEEVDAVLAAAVAQGLPDDDLALVRALYLERRPVADVAHQMAVTPRTVYNRKMAAVARLAKVAAA